MENKEEILNILSELKWREKAFNEMGGYLYSNILADEINTLMAQLKNQYGVEVKFRQYIPGRAEFINLDELIEKYS